MLQNTTGGIFTAERLDMPGAWQMPQGGIDAGEDTRTAALRELEEETSIPHSAVAIVKQTKDWLTYDLPDHLVGKVWGGRFKGQKQKWVLMQFYGNDGQINIATAHAEFSKWKWSSPHDLVAEIVPFKRQVYAAVVKELLSGL
jgi:putative (di)nucleoside polyphosphate hydrolase